MASGVQVSEEVKVLYQEMRKMSTKEDRCRIAVLKIDKEFIVVAKKITHDVCLCGGPAEGEQVKGGQAKQKKTNAFVKLMDELDNDECRYFLYDCHYTTHLSPKDELCFIMWSPDTAGIKQKMMYASSKEALKKEFRLKHVFEFHGKEEVNPREYCEKLSDVTKVKIISLEDEDL